MRLFKYIHAITLGSKYLEKNGLIYTEIKGGNYFRENAESLISESYVEALSTRVTHKIIIFFVIIGGDELF